MHSFVITSHSSWHVCLQKLYSRLSSNDINDGMLNCIICIDSIVAQVNHDLCLIELCIKFLTYW